MSDINLPEKQFLSVKDLRDAGLDFACSTYFRWRKEGLEPKFVRFGHNIIKYPRAAVLEWLEKLETRTTGHE